MTDDSKKPTTQDAIPRITATVPLTSPLAWAVWQRRLIDTMNTAIMPFLSKYTYSDGRLIWRTTWGDDTFQARDGVDDFYESFHNWPLFYLLGGADEVLKRSLIAWEAVTRQLTELGPVYKGYERGYDQFHQGEGYLFFYFLCLAEPTNQTLIAQAQRFAGFYLNEDLDAPNYDPEHRIIRAPHNGSGGPRWGYFDDDPIYPWTPYMWVYGLPYDDVPGVKTFDDLHDPALARRMGEVMQSRMGRGDVAANLIVTTLVTNAYLLTREAKYRDWVLDYVDAWRERAQANGDLLPDNVGLNGQVGEYVDGKWYGGMYGWAWPHGLHNIQPAAIVSAINAYLLTHDATYLEVPRRQLAAVSSLGAYRNPHTTFMSLRHHWVNQLSGIPQDAELWLVPYRHNDKGWFDYQPLPVSFPAALWTLRCDAQDAEAIDFIRTQSRYDWNAVIPHRTKEENGHEEPWLQFLAGENPSYPEAILAASYAVVCRRLMQIREDDADLTQVNIHHWQNLNPVVTEALVQLTLGTPQPIYYGGLLVAPLAYFDVERTRPGLPADVSALVEARDQKHIRLHLVNLSPFEAHTVRIRAGTLGQNRFTRVQYTQRTSVYPGTIGSATSPPLESDITYITLDTELLDVQLPPATEVHLWLDVQWFVGEPRYAWPTSTR